jgi:hypothetical protein
MSLTDSAFIPSDRAVPMVGGDPMDNLRPVEKNIVLFWLMMWYISIYSRLLRRCLPVSWMFGKNGIRLVFESRLVAQHLPAASTKPPEQGAQETEAQCRIIGAWGFSDNQVEPWLKNR